MTPIKTAVAFIYCMYAERHKQTIEQLTGSLIQQLLRQCQLPVCVPEFYGLWNTKSARPGLDDLSDFHRVVASRFTKVYLVVDALDKCNEADGTLEYLLDHLLRLESEKTQILFTLRPLDSIRSLQWIRK